MVKYHLLFAICAFRRDIKAATSLALGAVSTQAGRYANLSHQEFSLG